MPISAVRETPVAVLTGSAKLGVTVFASGRVTLRVVSGPVTAEAHVTAAEARRYAQSILSALPAPRVPSSWEMAAEAARSPEPDVLTALRHLADAASHHYGEDWTYIAAARAALARVEGDHA